MKVGSTSERYRPGPVRGQGRWVPSGELHALSAGEKLPLCGRAKPLVVRDDVWPPSAEGLGSPCPACSRLAAVELAEHRRAVLPQLLRSLAWPTVRIRRATLGDQQAG